MSNRGEQSCRTVVGVLESSGFWWHFLHVHLGQHGEALPTRTGSVDSLSASCNSGKKRLTDLWGGLEQGSKQTKVTQLCCSPDRGMKGLLLCLLYFGQMDFFSRRVARPRESLSHLCSSDTISAAVPHLLLHNSWWRVQNATQPHTLWSQNCLCILSFLFLRVLRFYLFLRVHTVLIIFHQRAATRGWADLMSVRGRPGDGWGTEGTGRSPE